ncbi:hypothetical protein SAMN06297144_0874 [Sphingomonas guangdongensis]|uniref:Uncharacterized protein n=1 Tax=Sphingomonas guangdongensis TaxID=1141890 RepID=A0A285QDQ7_9SPHN|nr:hypothetical protein SAMN06297144_0874 [Sphingomonas guangdongensis]
MSSLRRFAMLLEHSRQQTLDRLTPRVSHYPAADRRTGPDRKRAGRGE